MMPLIGILIFEAAIAMAISFYAVRVVIWVYKYKNTPKATIARISGVSSVALIAPVGAHLPEYFFSGGEELPLVASIVFVVSAISGMTLFFWLNRKILDELYHK